MSSTVGIILAAGKGVRMGKLTAEKPKALLEVNGQPLIQYMIDFVKRIGIYDIIVVGGHGYAELKKVVGLIDPNVTVVENKKFEMQNLISFATGLESIQGEKNIFVCNADYIFSENTAEAISKNLNDVSVYSSYDLTGDDDDVMTVKVDDHKNVIEMSKGLNEFDCAYTGAFHIPTSNLSLTREIIKKIQNENDPKVTTVEYLFPEFIKHGVPVRAADVGPADWYEIDTPDELVKAQSDLEKK